MPVTITTPFFSKIPPILIGNNFSDTEMSYSVRSGAGNNVTNYFSDIEMSFNISGDTGELISNIIYSTGDNEILFNVING